ncbi:hypothetical protein [Streptomyces mirabilis]|uniref:hypothetical protein n=1 Tax=Streptomyces mirabilis TaxID=68239 RepID=UPI003693A9A9
MSTPSFFMRSCTYRRVELLGSTPSFVSASDNLRDDLAAFSKRSLVYGLTGMVPLRPGHTFVASYGVTNRLSDGHVRLWVLLLIRSQAYLRDVVAGSLPWVGVEFDVCAEGAAVEDRAGAWRFVEGFGRCWREPISAGDGCSYEELTEAEYRLRSPLPIALCDVYGLLGRRADLTGVQDRLLPLEQLRIADGALVFRLENQAVAEWAVRQEDLEKDDPPVVFRRTDGSAPDWSPFLDRFSLACVARLPDVGPRRRRGPRASPR